MLVGKWKLTSHWYKDADRKRTFSKIEIGQVFYEFIGNGTYKRTQVKNKDTTSNFGEWDIIIDRNTTHLVLDNNYYYFEGKRYDMINIELILKKISINQFYIKGDSYFEEGSDSTINNYNSTFEKL